MRVLLADEMREVDRRAIEELGIPGPVLMENAAIGLADAIGDAFPAAGRVLIVCGPGNNGGDGFALARHLDGRGYEAQAFLLGAARPSGDALLQLEILERAGFACPQIGPGEDLSPLLEAAGRADLLVDALFGTGLKRPLEGFFAEAASLLAGLGKEVLAVDLPSGLDASLAHPVGPCLPATVSVTFAAPKLAHLLAPACDLCGRLVVADLGLPAGMVDAAPGSFWLTTAEELSAELLPRPLGAHKGDFGHLLLLGGSAGKAGAMVLAARAAVRGGAGLVTAAVPAPLLEVVDGNSLESMTLPLAEKGGGFAAAGWDELAAALAGKNALAVGPGLGRGEEAFALVRRLVGESQLPLALDADGLNAFAGDLQALAGRPGPTVLTPHPGELGRLLGIGAAEVEQDRVAAALAAAERSRAVVVLKGRRSLIASPEGELWINPTGHPILASGGSGDVLTGLLGALLAQGYESLAAARLAVFLHGLAGEQLAAQNGARGGRAGDLVEQLPAAWRSLAEPELADA
jgi:ADP-dependent NAD(P)H-hydrate dehydratase / NAD(P)H-hydrate epimerase